METLTLTELTQRMATRWRLLLTAAVLGLAAGLAVALTLPTRYEAHAVVHVDATDPARIDMAAEEALVASRRVTGEALDALGDEHLTIDELEAAASASTVKDSRVLHVAYTAARPGAAADGANALANAYLAVRSVEAADARRRAASTAEVVDPARAPTSAVGPGAPAMLVAGLGLGLLIAAPAAARPTRSREARVS